MLNASVVVKKRLYAFDELSPSAKERILEHTIEAHLKTTPYADVDDRIKMAMFVCEKKKDDIAKLILKWNYNDYDCIKKLVKSHMYSEFGDVAYSETHSTESPLMVADWDMSEQYKEKKM
jgi:hypothetical protein